MDKYYDVIKQALDLSETGLEGLEHIKSRVNEGHFEDTIPLFEDVLNSYYVMEKTLQPILEHVQADQLQQQSNKLRKALDLVVATYEQGEAAKALEIMQFNLLPNYKKWQAELDSLLRPYISS